MSTWFRHDAMGRVVTVGQCPDGQEHFYEYAGETLVVGPSANTYTNWYDIAAQQLHEREPPVIETVGTRVVGIPVPCELRITGPVVLNATLDEPELTLTFDVPGTYTLEFRPEHPRWLFETVILEVDE